MAHPAEGLSSQFDASPAELEELYDDWADDYDDDMDAWGYEVPETLASVLEEREVVGPILDAGCGTGRSGAALADVGLGPLVGIDLSPESLAQARLRQVYAETRQVDLTGPVPFEDESFAAVVSAGVLTYFDDTDSVLREFLRVVAPGGTVVFSHRTDLWADRDFDGVLRRLVDDGLCTAEQSTPQPYLPGHPEYGDSIQVIYVELTRNR